MSSADVAFAYDATGYSQVNLENMLSERSQSQLITYYMIPCDMKVQNREVDRDRGRLVVSWG